MTLTTIKLDHVQFGDRHYWSYSTRIEGHGSTLYACIGCGTAHDAFLAAAAKIAGTLDRFPDPNRPPENLYAEIPLDTVPGGE